MISNLVAEITTKAARLPLEKQRETLELVESLSEESAAKKSFESVESILSGNLDNLENDIAEIRCEA